MTAHLTTGGWLKAYVGDEEQPGSRMEYPWELA
jgi:hypothetical protein